MPKADFVPNFDRFDGVYDLTPRADHAAGMTDDQIRVESSGPRPLDPAIAMVAFGGEVALLASSEETPASVSR